ncbi:MarR family winged helix-turn-helix transcriptional regulator [Streptomyces sp. CRN 30]|uniref:MarR family winged helix-turn-helix transcriptional regulator n=1 Tax=Streptomyces sp. CRN 30 TaxID=3075613 RepID=UPI002A840F04|nr:MarR family transcriptional regulator [Streptomyces sp. CRN 30]
MTRLNGPDDAPAHREGDDPNLIARDIAGAVDSLTTLWSLAAQGAVLRLSLHQLRALRVLEAAPGINLTALSQRLEIGAPTASRLCDRLEAAGLLERESHPRRRREVQLRLSPHGRRVLGDVAERRAQALAAALAMMAPADRAALRRGLRSFLSAGDAGTRPAVEPRPAIEPRPAVEPGPAPE